MYVCLCADKSIDEIKDAIENGATSMDDLMDELLVATGCGICTRAVQKILDDTISSSFSE